jgi:hypothetical protein
VDETADRLLSEMSSDKRDRLGAEMEHGLDVNIVRTSAEG